MSKFPRREFLKVAAAGIGGVTLGTVFGKIKQPAEIHRHLAVSRTTRRFFREFPTTCEICPARCGIIGLLHHSKLALLQGNPRHPENQGKICARGLAGINLTYDPERILFPLRRDGKRGSGRWKPISWKAALDEISSRLLTKSRNPNKLVIESGTEDLLARRFVQALGNAKYANHLPGTDVTSEQAHQKIWGAGSGIADVARSTYILAFGANPYENHPQFIGFINALTKAQVEQHTKFIIFDPRLSNSAGKADGWHPVAPGSDRFIILAMANYLITHGLADEQFLRTRMNTDFSQLAQTLSPFTFEKAAAISGIAAQELQRIAHEFGTIDRPVALGGHGLSLAPNSAANHGAILLLNAIAGAIDQPGGYCLPAELPQLPTLSPTLPVLPTQADNKINFLAQIESGEIHPDVYLTHCYNPVFTLPQPAMTTQLLKNSAMLPFHVAVDTHLTETAALADLFLPAATDFERWNIQYASGINRVPILNLTRPVAQPLSEQIALKSPTMTRQTMLTQFFQPPGAARALDDICLALAQKSSAAIKKFFSFTSTREYVKRIANQIEGLSEQGGFAYLEKFGFWLPAGKTSAYSRYLKTGFQTPSGKMEFQIAEMAATNPALSTPVKTSSAGGLENLSLITFSRNVMSPRLANCKWLSEIAHDNPLWINPVTAQKIGVQTGDLVRVETAAGSITTKVRVTEGIRPQTVAIARDFGHWAFGNIAQAKKFKSADPDTGLLWWESEGSGINPNAILPKIKKTNVKSLSNEGIKIRISKV